MNRFLIALFCAAILAEAAVAQPIPIFENFGAFTVGTNTPPQVDAIAFANYGQFFVSSFLPYDFTDVRHFTNTGTMDSTPGFIFDTAFSSGARQPAQDFYNAPGATITAEDGFNLGLGPLSAQGNPSYLKIAATNITVQGILSAGASGLLRIEGNHVNLSRGGLEVRAITAGFNNNFPGSTNFFPDAGISDLYWASTNGLMGPATLLSISAIATNINVPRHSVTNAGGFRGSQQFTLRNPFSFVQTNAVTETNWLVQGAFIATSDPNLLAEVRMANSQIFTNLYKTVIAHLAMPETNVVTGNVTFQDLYLRDDLASSTNYDVAVNAQTGDTYRPMSYELSRSAPNDWANANPPTGALRPDLFFDASLSNNIVTNFYAAYSAQIASTPIQVPNIPEIQITNYPGRVEIQADNLDLSRTRIRGNAIIDIHTPNLLSSSNAVVDAPNLNFNIGAIQSVLNVTNLAKATVARLSGSIRAWSAVWTNDSGSVSTNIGPDPNDATLMVTNVTTNVIEIGYHIFALDATSLQTTAPVITHDLVMNASDVVLSDTLNVIGNFLDNSTSFTLKGNLTFSSPLVYWQPTNAPNVMFFTNLGTLFVPSTATFTDGRAPYTNFVNYGTLAAGGMSLDTAYFQNSGTIAGFYDGVHVTMDTGLLQGGTVSSAGDVTYNATSLKMFNYTNTVTGALTFNVSGGFADSGAGSANVATVNRGFFLPVKPAAGDLLGTTIHTTAARFSTVPHIWAGEDRGTNAVGYENNEAIGVLVLDAQADGTLEFSPATGANALYVDELDLNNAVLTALQSDDLESALQIDPGMVIYFATSNQPAEQLDGQLGGRLLWVPSFFGPNSSVDVLRRNGQIVQMNKSVRESTVIDSDGDGIPNAYDQYPLDPDPLTLTSVERNTPPPTVSFVWDAQPMTVYQVEYTSSLGSGDWQPLTLYTNSSTTATSAMIEDAVSSGAAQRYYRVHSVGQLK